MQISLVYHYTVGVKLPLIAAAQELRPSSVALLPGERPVLWFSKRQDWEPTATKLIVGSGGYGPYLPSVEELHRMMGLVRFGISARQLVPWAALIRKARIPVRMVQHLIERGIEQGAKPTDWFGSLEPIPLHALCFEQWNGRSWVTVDESALGLTLQ